MKNSCFIPAFILVFVVFSCCKTKSKASRNDNSWTVSELKNRANSHLDKHEWNLELLTQDIATFLKYDSVFEQYPLSNHPFPVADYDYAVFSNPFKFKTKSAIFKGIEIGEYKNPESEEKTTKLTLIVLTNNEQIEHDAFVDSRNFPYLTAEGIIQLEHTKYNWAFQSTPDGFSSLFFSMKLFDLRFGETIVIFPMKDKSFRYVQIDDSPNKYSKLNDYIDHLKKDNRIKAFI